MSSRQNTPDALTTGPEGGSPAGARSSHQPSPVPPAVPTPQPEVQPREHAGHGEDTDLLALDRLVDDLRRQAQRPPGEDPRGLLPIPPLVQALVAREACKRQFTAEDRERLTNNLTLQYFFEDRDVLFRHTPQGIEVLAAGMDEINEALARLTLDERREWTYGQG